MSSQFERITKILDIQSISTNVEILESIINDSSQLFPIDISEDFKKKIEDLKNKIIYTSSNNKSLNEFEMVPGSGSHGIYSINSNGNNNSDQPSSSTNQKEITKVINILQESKTSNEREEIFEDIISWLNDKKIDKKI